MLENSAGQTVEHPGRAPRFILIIAGNVPTCFTGTASSAAGTQCFVKLLTKRGPVARGRYLIAQKYVHVDIAGLSPEDGLLVSLWEIFNGILSDCTSYRSHSSL